MGSVSDKLLYLQDTKSAIKDAIVAKGVVVPNGTTFRGYAGKIAEISGGTGSTCGVVEWSESFWQSELTRAQNAIPARPSDWLTLPTVTDSDNIFVGLHAVHEESNYVALTAAGNYTVDWGDGVIENYNANVQANHEYNYTAISDTTLCSGGYKQVIVKVYPQAGQTFTSIDLDKKHTKTGLQKYSSEFLEIVISGASLTTIKISGIPTTINFSKLVSVSIYNNSVTSMSYMFNNCYSLTTIPLLNTSAVIGMSYMFNNCYNLTTIPLLNTSKVINMDRMFLNCTSLTTIPLLNTSAVTSMSDMFQSCYSLTTIPLLNTSKVTNMDRMFYNCPSLTTIPLLNTSAVTSMSNMFFGCYSLTTIPLLNTSKVTNMGSMFIGCTSLSKAPLKNINVALSVSGLKLSSKSINEIFKGTKYQTSSKTLTVSSNPGIDTAVTKSCGLTSGSTTVTLSNTTDLFVGQPVIGTGMNYLSEKTVSVSNSVDTFTSTGHGLGNGTPIATNILHTAIDNSKVYYTTDVTANTFKLSETVGGTAISFGTSVTLSGYKFRAGSYITSITTDTSITLSAPATSTSTQTLTFRSILDPMPALIKNWAITY